MGYIYACDLHSVAKRDPRRDTSPELHLLLRVTNGSLDILGRTRRADSAGTDRASLCIMPRLCPHPASHTQEPLQSALRNMSPAEIPKDLVDVHRGEPLRHEADIAIIN